MARRYAMEFERPLFELEDKLAELRKLDVSANEELATEIEAPPEVARRRELDPTSDVEVQAEDR
jgi:hypothetical protein